MKEVLKKVLLQFGNEDRVLEGEDAQKWYDANLAFSCLAYIHGQTLPELDWRIIKKKIKNAKKNK